MKKRIYFTVTNDLNFDQRMQRICTSLSTNGYEVVLVGRKLRASKPLLSQPFQQKRIRCFFNKGFLFYAEYNTRLFFWLLFQKINIICAIDLDTILPCLFVSKIKGSQRVYDAHELFTELKEVKTNPRVQKIWLRIEKFCIPKFKYCYTVCDSIAHFFEEKYGVPFGTIRNLPLQKKILPNPGKEKYFIYSGAVNEARGFEALIPAMQFIDKKLVVCGDGNFMLQAQKLVRDFNVQSKVKFRGMLMPDVLDEEIRKGHIGINLVENTGLNQYFSLANKFFDYIQLGIPQISMQYPEYKKINNEYTVAVLLNDLNVERLASAMNNLMDDVVLYGKLKNNCSRAAGVLSWQNEELKLLEFYKNIQ